jgi:SAM-dependent methyltransferase
VIGASPTNQARDAYETLAPVYDAFIDGYPHERWVLALEDLARIHGLAGRRLLDVACGTGASFLPLLRRGYAVTGCDISASMLEQARQKAPQTPLHVADMRALPLLGSFDLITCLDDPLNYLLEEADVSAAMRGFARNLAPGGLVIWDVNTLSQYRRQFAADRIVAGTELFVGWSGLPGDRSIESGGVVEVTIEIFARGQADSWRRSTSLHRQRHWPDTTLRRLAHAAGLQVIDVRGQRPGAVIEGQLDDLVHTKAIYVACITEGGA